METKSAVIAALVTAVAVAAVVMTMKTMAAAAAEAECLYPLWRCITSFGEYGTGGSTLQNVKRSSIANEEVELKGPSIHVRSV